PCSPSTPPRSPPARSPTSSSPARSSPHSAAPLDPAARSPLLVLRHLPVEPRGHRLSSAAQSPAEARHQSTLAAPHPTRPRPRALPLPRPDHHPPAGVTPPPAT